jgi:hypothetical protein
MAGPKFFVITEFDCTILNESTKSIFQGCKPISLSQLHDVICERPFSLVRYSIVSTESISNQKLSKVVIKSSIIVFPISKD